MPQRSVGSNAMQGREGQAGSSTFLFVFCFPFLALLSYSAVVRSILFIAWGPGVPERCGETVYGVGGLKVGRFRFHLDLS